MTDMTLMTSTPKTYPWVPQKPKPIIESTNAHTFWFSKVKNTLCTFRKF